MWEVGHDLTKFIMFADAKFAQILAQEFNLLLPETSNWFMHEPEKGVFDFSKTDALVDWATKHHMAIFSFFGGWSNGLPGLADEWEPTQIYYS